MDGCSSEWSYWDPYNPDISAALHRLREEIFALGNFSTADSVITVGRRFFIPSSRPRPKPANIEELLEQEGDKGTHSILDITGGISPKFKRRCISAFPSSLFLEYFSSETPSPSEVQEVYEFGSLEKFVTKRWQGIYIVAHFDGTPSDIFFAGCSGD